ncbi:ATP-binding protein [Streptomyces sp. NPDC005355]|uniref:ATP-binding protein n=1 Tax=Streptomyces sp. NPDC005355 TaxID=3157038 RepID=UPI0033A740CD
MSSTSEFAQPAAHRRPALGTRYDYLLGGKTNYPPDQAAGRALAHRHPQLRQARSEDESGRGLALIAALADEWDAQPRACGIGKTVWFELKIVMGASLP